MSNTTRPTFGSEDGAPLYSTFASRVCSFNRRQKGARMRALWSTSKANREAYGVPSANAVFILDENAGRSVEAKHLAKVLKGADAFGLDLGMNPDVVITATVMGGYDPPLPEFKNQPMLMGAGRPVK